MLGLLLGLSLILPSEPIVRDSFGVPHIQASTREEAFYYAGYAVAQDRLWQMENSRRLARGRMSEVFGNQFVSADRETLRTFYTDEELTQQLEKLSPEARLAFRHYARGVNAYIEEAKQGARLPAGYAAAGFEPEPWLEIDSVAIAVRLFHQFGRGGAGEIRNMALLGYLQTRAPLEGRVLDVLDDFAWQNEPAALTTIASEDDPLRHDPPRAPQLTRPITERHVAMLPSVSPLELLPAIRLAEREETRLVAERVGVPSKAGSYAVVVSPQRSATGWPILLSAPQMGFRSPSIVHEMSIKAPGYEAVGMDLPGVPGILIGYTPYHAWALTSGVADTDDIFFFPMEGEGSYRYGEESRHIEVIRQELEVRSDGGTAQQTVEQRRTHLGPIILSSASGKAHFARRSSYWMRELESYDALLKMTLARSPDEIEQSLDQATMSFNYFYATVDGQIGYRYLGLIPQRADGLDPRFPTPGRPEYEWRGFMPQVQMPRVRNPRSGLLLNWNNKPVAWWNNYDTPIWGKIFRNSELVRALDQAKVSVEDVEMAAWQIARSDPTHPHFKEHLDAGLAAGPASPQVAAFLRAFDGRMFQGSIAATAYEAYFSALREELFLEPVGNFLSPQNFQMIVQPSVMLNALEGRTRFDYRAGRTSAEISAAAIQRATEGLRQRLGDDVARWRYAPPSINFPSQAPVPYAERGTYIQILELLEQPIGRSVLPPGVAESGPHATDQIPLARAWSYKPMGPPR
jgi:penicillin G amidase